MMVLERWRFKIFVIVFYSRRKIPARGYNGMYILHPSHCCPMISLSGERMLGLQAWPSDLILRHCGGSVSSKASA